jgi:hypothetical protein
VDASTVEQKDEGRMSSNVPDDLRGPETLGDNKPLVTIYVRKGGHERERTIAISPIRQGVDPLTLRDAGFALDRNSATLSVDPCTAVFDVGEHGKFANDDIRAIGQFDSVDPPDWAAGWSLTKAVNNVRERIVAWLESLGCEVKFG